MSSGEIKGNKSTNLNNGGGGVYNPVFDSFKK